MHPSPITPIDAEECAWLHGKLWYVQRLEPLEPRAYDPGDVPDLPVEQQTPLVDVRKLFGWSLVILFLIVFWSIIVALVVRVLG